jgi:hypothetical protein
LSRRLGLVLASALFEQIMSVALKPKADPRRHPEASYHGLRLCGLDGSQFSIANTPQVKRQMRKARSRRGRAAFPKVGAAVMVEPGLRNPLAAACLVDRSTKRATPPTGSPLCPFIRKDIAVATFAARALWRGSAGYNSKAQAARGLVLTVNRVRFQRGLRAVRLGESFGLTAKPDSRSCSYRR